MNELPKLYRTVYVISTVDHDEDDKYPADAYVQARLALDDDNNKFWQVLNIDQNLFDYEYSVLDIYDLDVKWSKNKDPIETRRENHRKSNHSYSRNRLTIEERFNNDEIPF